MDIGGFLKNSILANKAIDHAAMQSVIKAVGADAAKGGEALGGKLGALKQYNNAMKKMEAISSKADKADEIIKEVGSATQTLFDRTGTKSVEGAIDKTLSKENAQAAKEGIADSRYDAINKHIDKQAKAHISAYKEAQNNPGNIKDSMERLQGVNADQGRGTMGSYYDAAKSYLTGGDIRAAMKSETNPNGISMGQAIGMGATRGAVVVGGTAAVIGGTRAVGHAIFGDTKGKDPVTGYGYSY